MRGQGVFGNGSVSSRFPPFPGHNGQTEGPSRVSCFLLGVSKVVSCPGVSSRDADHLARRFWVLSCLIWIALKFSLG